MPDIPALSARMASRSLIYAALLAVALVLTWSARPISSTAATTTPQISHAYDLSLPGVHPATATQLADEPARLSVAQEGSASPSVESRGVSTTSSCSVVATTRLWRPVRSSQARSLGRRVCPVQRTRQDHTGRTERAEPDRRRVRVSFMRRDNSVSSQVPPGMPQVLYPQCLACSNDQVLYIINMMRGGPR